MHFEKKKERKKRNLKNSALVILFSLNNSNYMFLGVTLTINRDVFSKTADIQTHIICTFIFHTL